MLSSRRLNNIRAGGVGTSLTARLFTTAKRRSRKPQKWPTIHHHNIVPSAVFLPRYSPRDNLFSTPMIRRRHVAKLQMRQAQTTKRTFSNNTEDQSNDIRKHAPVSVLALPLCHRPLLPGMTIELQLPPSLYNKLLTQMHITENHSGLVGTFLVDTASTNASEPVEVGGKVIPGLEPSQPISPALHASQFVDVPHLNDIHHIGTLCRVTKLTSDRHLVLESLRAIEATALTDPNLLTVTAFPLSDDVDDSVDESKELAQALLEAAKILIGGNSKYAPQLELVVSQAETDEPDIDLSTLVNQIAGLCTDIAPLQEQQLLSERSVTGRAHRLLTFMGIESTTRR